MALKVPLRLLSFVLLLLMHGHGSGAREMKVLQEEQVEQKHENQPYITTYTGPPVSKADDSYASQYKAAYTFKNYNHPSENGFYTSQYKAAYHPRKHIHPMQDNNVHNPSQNYLFGYRHKNNDQEDDSYSGYNVAHTPRKHNHQQDQKEMGKPYITANGNSDSEKASENSQKDSKEKNQPNYITVYGDSKANTEKKASDQDPNYKVDQKKGGKSSKVDHTEAFRTGFFALDDIYVGNTMTLKFPVQDFAHFLSRKEADSIPFSTSQLRSVLQLFSVTEDSHEGKAMRDTLGQCELETITGETKVCVTSLESMIEFVQSILGTEDKYNILTTSYPSESSASLQKYTIVKVSEDIYAPKWVACHPMPYPYAVFFCHFINTGSKVFKVSLAGENGDNMEALGLCHMDTSDWNPNHILFEQLGFKPGDAPVCHFFPVKHLLWVPLPSKAAM